METIQLVVTKRVRSGEESDYGSCWREQTFFDDMLPIARTPTVGEEIEIAGEQFTITRVIWRYDYESGPLRRLTPRVEAR